MIRNKILLKSIVIFLILEILIDSVSPTLSMALTSGPTAPEATSFEPIDTTDMVHLSSGDFVYNIPLLEVPGPSGGYPLSLSYHAGIQPGEDASWTGLGWTLNPGSISRNINGFPDDYHGENTTDRVFWEGGISKSYSVGVSIGFKGAAEVGVGLAYSKDTYKGVGVGVEFSAGVGIYSASVGVSAYGELSVGVSAAMIDVSTDLQSVGVSINGGGSSINFNANSNSLDVSASIGATLHTNKKGRRLTVGGGTVSVTNNKNGNISTDFGSIGISIPIYAVTISLGYNFRRYWIDQTEKVLTHGSLYNPKSASNFDGNSYDSYSHYDPVNNSTNKPDPSLTTGPSFLNYDDYDVNAQGVSGSIRPYHFKSLIVRQNKKNNDEYQIKQYKFNPDDFPTENVEYRFINDFSNRHVNENGGWSSQQTRLETDYGSSITGENGDDGVVNNHLAGTRHIEWYTNREILGDDMFSKPFAEGFVDCSATGFDRASTPADLIGGFKITNESGVTYHFALPAYAYDEYQYSENINRADGLTFNEFKRPAKYAYTWFLTAVTGPDYVDRGGENNDPNHIIDENDWGYWVSFEYGKWTENYAWRNPDQRYQEDMDKSFRNYASGKREVYYLDAIKTKTHTAVFVKEIRMDAKSSAYAFNLQKKSDLGFLPSDFNETIGTRKWFTNPNCTDVPTGYSETFTTVSHRTYPISSLKLKKIFLFDNNILKKEILQEHNIPSINSLKQVGDLYKVNLNFDKNIHEVSVSYSCDFQETSTTSDRIEPTVIPLHLPENVFDSDDLKNLNGDFNKALRIIDFETDYSLEPETPNSFDHSTLTSSSSLANETEYPYEGKLTLKKLHFLGKNGQTGLLPPISFQYDYSTPKTGSGYISNVEGNRLYSFNQINSGLEPGDIIKFVSDAKECYALIRSKSDAVHILEILGRNVPTLEFIQWKKTKNPPYNRNHYDVWGLYKPDYRDPVENPIRRYTTPISAKSVDAWSLREIHTSLGAKISIEYESDTYRKAIMQGGCSLMVNSIQFLSLAPDDEYSAKFSLEINTEGKDLRDIYQVDSDFQCFLPLSFYGTNTGSQILWENGFLTSGRVTAVTSTTIEAIIGPHFFAGSNGTTYYGGNIFYDENYENVGGGFRVKTISIDDEIGGISKSISYDYSINGLTTGVTSYEPNIAQKLTLDGADEAMSRLATFLNFGRFEKIFQNAREVPAPGVMYETVTVEEKVKRNGITLNSLGKTRYQFHVLNEKMIGYEIASNNSTDVSDNYDGILFQKVIKKDIILKDYTQWVGKLKSISNLDKDGKKISETVNEFLHEKIPNIEQKSFSQIGVEYNTLLHDYSDMGVLHESTWSGRFVKINDDYQLFGIVSHRQTFPLIQTGQTTTNFKTGVSSKTENKLFDFYSGQVTESISTDGYGNSFVTKVIPAYRKYPGMGLALDGGMNMLTQEAANFVYKADPSDNYSPTGLVSASAQTWNGQIPIVGTSELQETITVQLAPKATDGLFYITDQNQNFKIRIGEQIKFNLNSKDYFAKVMNQDLSGPWNYGLNIIGEEPLLSSAVADLSVTRIQAYKKHRHFSFIGDNSIEMTPEGLTLLPDKNLPEFNAWNTNATPPGWQKNSEITLYDVYSHSLEGKDLNQNYVATKMSYDQTKVFATVANSQYDEFAFSGAEELSSNGVYGGNVMKGNGTEVFKQNLEDNFTTHTGNKALQVTSNSQKAFQYTFVAKANRGYHASVWVNSNAGRLFYSVNGVTQSPGVPSENRKAGSWYLVSIDIPKSTENSTIEIWSATIDATCNFDDFRVCPLDAAMTSYVYNEWGELSHILDNNNLYTKFEYDGMGRLTSTFKETFANGTVHISEQKYHYARQQN